MNETERLTETELIEAIAKARDAYRWDYAAQCATELGELVGARTVEGLTAIMAEAQVFATMHLAQVIETASQQLQYGMGANAAAMSENRRF
ncbi:hypothetical protein BH09ACT9_BH09ACT9_00480 [soil metagenome]